MDPTQKEPRVNVPAILVGVVAIVTSCFGLCYNAMSAFSALSGTFDQLLKQEDLPYFHQAFWIISGVCVICFIMLIACGIDLVRSRLRWSLLVILVLLFEVGYFFAVGSIWLAPNIGQSVAAATGVANGGLMAQFIIFFPLWAPLLLWWAKAKQPSIEAA
ncbi:MAG: hypothetical protein SH868_06905 [Bythopirellula sp.]|nr:hypothetical protein [Bythopirellula sp.]